MGRSASHVAASGGNANFIWPFGIGIGFLVMKHGSICSSEKCIPQMDCAYYKMKCPPKLLSAHFETEDEDAVYDVNSIQSIEAVDEDVGEFVHVNKSVFASAVVAQVLGSLPAFLEPMVLQVLDGGFKRFASLFISRQCRSFIEGFAFFW